LRAGEATPDASPGDGEKEQQTGAGDHQSHQQGQVTPGQGAAEQVDAALLERKQQPGLAVELYPDQAEKQRDHWPAGEPAPVLETPFGEAYVKLAVPR
jgi:hypothetical protein